MATPKIGYAPARKAAPGAAAIDQDDAKAVAAMIDAHPHLLTEGGYRWIKTTYFSDTSPLFFASYVGSPEVVKLLLARGADVNARSRGYPPGKHIGAWTPLHMAARAGHKDVAELLLERGADINAAGSCAMTPLYQALLLKHPDMARFLIEKGADLNVKKLNPDGGDETALILAIRGYPDIAKVMIEKGADLELRGFQELTPLHVAVRLGKKDLVKLLLEKGAKVNALCHSFWEPGATALDMARAKDIADLLIEHGGTRGPGKLHVRPN